MIQVPGRSKWIVVVVVPGGIDRRSGRDRRVETRSVLLLHLCPPPAERPAKRAGFHAAGARPDAGAGAYDDEGAGTPVVLVHGGGTESSGVGPKYGDETLSLACTRASSQKVATRSSSLMSTP